MAIITSYADDAVTTDDDKFLTSNSAGTTVLTPASNINKYLGNGWTIATDTWSYSSYSSATNIGVITTTAGANTRYTIGMKVKFSQPTLGLKYGFITTVNSSSIEVSFVGGTVLSNEAITLPFYSVANAPFGYPTESPVITTGYSDVGTAPNTVTHNGNRSYDLVFNSVDYTSVLSPGMRLRTQRTVSAPTQSTSLNGTTQYWVKTSPNKLTFTDDFVVSAWVKLSSYGSANGIVSRYNGTSGWLFSIESDGTVKLRGNNGSSANLSQVTSYQSIPLNKWVHITAQLDMSAFTATTTTSYIMIDGVDVPVTVSRGGTNPTALVQAGNLEVGTYNAGQFFPGKIAQVAIFNAKVTQATMRTYISQGLAGTETSLASAYSFNGVTTDLNTTTPNDLSAGAGSPTATNADSPFGTQASGLISSTLDYGIVQAATFSTNTTLTVQVPEGCTIPTSGGVSAVSYSSVKAPYGFPSDIGKWQIQSVSKTTLVVATPVSGTWYRGSGTDSWRITVPIGSWVLSYRTPLYVDRAAAAVVTAYSTLSTTTSTETDTRLTSFITANPVTVLSSQAGQSASVSVGAQTNYNALFKTASASMTNIDMSNQLGAGIITAENGYL